MPYDNQGNLVPCRALRARGLKLVGRNVAVRVVSSRPTRARGFVGGDMAGV